MTTSLSDPGGARWRGRPFYPTRDRLVDAVALGSDLDALVAEPAEAGTPLDPQAIAEVLASDADPDRVAMSLLQWIPAAEEQLVAGELAALPIWIVGVVMLAEMSRSDPESPLAKYAAQALTRARERTTAWHFHGARSWIELAQVGLAVKRGDLGIARIYALAAHAAVTAASSSAFDLVPAAGEDLARILSNLATAMFKAGSHAAALELATFAAEHHAGDKQAFHILGQAYAKLGKFKEAAGAWQRYSELVPDSPTGQMNRATCLVQIGRLDEALAAAENAIKIAPRDARMYYGRGTLLEAAGQMKEAAGDYRDAYRLAADHLTMGGDVTDERQFMFMALSRLFATLGDDEEGVKAELDELKSSDRPAWREAGYFFSGPLALARGDEEAALADLAMAIELDPSDLESRLFRAKIHLDRGDVAAAADDLRHAGARERKPERVVELLDPFIVANPDDVLARKWRGYANQQRQYSLASKPDLILALAAMPDDLDLQYWDVLADLVMVPVDLEKPDLNEIGIDIPKVTGALKRLAIVAAKTRDDEQIRVYRWFVDRLGLAGRFLSLLEAGAEAPGGWFSLSPNVKTALSRYRQGLALNSIRHWSDAIDLFASSAAIFKEEGYLCLSAMASLNLADTFIRTYELDRARDAVAAADRLTVVHGRSLSAVFKKTDDYFQRQSEDREAMTFELEYLPIYGVGLTDFNLRLKVLKADLAYRLGALDQAVKEIGDLDEFCRSVTEAESFRMMFTAFTIFRDSMRFEEAERIAGEAEKLADDPVSIATLENGRALMLLQRGDYVESEVAVRRAMAALGQDESDADQTFRTTLAQTLYRQGRFEEALRPLELRSGTTFRSPNDEAMFHFLKATVYTALTRNEDANLEFGVALGIIEQLRARLDLDDRKTWQERFAGFFEDAAMHALAAGDARRAFDLVERSRGRALLDEIVSDAAVSPEVKTLLERKQRNETRRIALDALLGGGETSGIDYELIHAAARDEEAVKRLVTEEGKLAPDAARTMLDDVKRNIAAIDKKIARAESAGTQFQSGQTASFDEVLKLVRESDVPVVFAAYFIADLFTHIFFVRRDDDEPKVLSADVMPGDLAAVQEWTKAVRAGDPSPEVPDELRKLVEPLIQMSAAGDTLWIVPLTAAYDAPLHAVEVGGERLIDRNPVVYTPSASIMRACREVARRTLDDALIVGDPLGDLPYAREEAMRIAALVRATPLIGGAATPEAVQEHASRGSIDLMHFAAHGWFDEADAMRSGIVLTGPPGSLTPEAILTAEDLRRLDFDTDLIVVSGCETGRSGLDPGEEMMGLTRGLLIAGTRSLVVSLWNVADISTIFLMRAFYDRLINGKLGRAAALREAQRWLRTLTASEVVDELDRDARSASDAGDERRYVMLRIAAASTLAASGDEAKALAICEEILGRVTSAQQRGAAELVAGVADSIRKRKGRVAFDEHPFAAPYYWAPFILVGSWD